MEAQSDEIPEQHLLCATKGIRNFLSKKGETLFAGFFPQIIRKLQQSLAVQRSSDTISPAW